MLSRILVLWDHGVNGIYLGGITHDGNFRRNNCDGARVVTYGILGFTMTWAILAGQGNEHSASLSAGLVFSMAGSATWERWLINNCIILQFHPLSTPCANPIVLFMLYDDPEMIRVAFEPRQSA